MKVWWIGQPLRLAYFVGAGHVTGMSARESIAMTVPENKGLLPSCSSSSLSVDIKCATDVGRSRRFGLDPPVAAIPSGEPRYQAGT